MYVAVTLSLFGFEMRDSDASGTGSGCTRYGASITVQRTQVQYNASRIRTTQKVPSPRTCGADLIKPHTRMAN